MSHTPGPLTFENDDSGICGEPCEQWLIRDPSTDSNDIVAIVPKTGDEEYDNEVTYPNVKLIAAAPELLEAITGLFDHCAMIHKHWGDGDNRQQADAAIATARAAIAKATE